VTRATSAADQATRFQTGDVAISTITVTGAVSGAGINRLSVAGDFGDNTVNVLNRINSFTVTGVVVDTNGDNEMAIGASGGITTLTAGVWDTDLVTRDTGTFKVVGNSAKGFAGNVIDSTFTITGNAGGASAVALGALSATGTVLNSVFNVNGSAGGVTGGNVTSVTAGRFIDSSLFVGFH